MVKNTGRQHVFRHGYGHVSSPVPRYESWVRESTCKIERIGNVAKKFTIEIQKDSNLWSTGCVVGLYDAVFKHMVVDGGRHGVGFFRVWIVSSLASRIGIDDRTEQQYKQETG